MILYGWGSSQYGQIGYGGTENLNEPQIIEFFEGKDIKCISAGNDHTLACDTSGVVYSFGSNDNGQLGHFKRRLRPENIEALDVFPIVQVACGSTHSLALTVKGEVLSWGLGERGQLGQGFEQMTTEPQKPRIIKAFEKDHIVQISAGDRHCAALSEDGKVWVWGENSKFQLGNGNCVPLHTPEFIESFKGRPIKKIACGGNHTLALSVSGSVYAWGDNSFGQLGIGDFSQSSRPKPIETLRGKNIVDIVCGENHSVAISHDGKVYTFGSGSSGQLGHQGYQHEPAPKVIADLSEYSANYVGCGRRHTVIYIPQIRKLYTFGLNACGQLGHQVGGEKGTSSPFSVKSLEGSVIKGVFVGGDRTFVLTQNEENGDKKAKLENELQSINVAKYVLDTQGTSSVSFNIANSTLNLRNSIMAINKLTISKLLEEAQGTNNYAHLQRVVDVVFSSISCMNASFLNETHMSSSIANMGIDLDDIVDTYKLLYLCPEKTITNTIGNATSRLVDSLLKFKPGQPEAMRVFLIVLKNPLFQEPSIYHVVCQKLVNVFVGLFEKVRDVLSQWIALLSPQHFSKIVDIFEKFISFLLTSKPVDLATSIAASCVTLKWLYDINLKSGEKLPPKMFYNKEVSKINLANDYNTWISQTNQFCFCNYPFLFEMPAKDQIIYYDKSREMNIFVTEFFISFAARMNQLPQNVVIPLKVRRDHLLEDCMDQIPKFAPIDLKRPLCVIFNGEEGFDEGGPRKEFFYLITPEIKNESFGVFVHDEETQTLQFKNSSSPEHLKKCNLVGKIVGLAVYNSCLTDLPLSHIVYKKLLNFPINDNDFDIAFPTLSASLKKMLEFSGDNFEDTFGINFRISYQGQEIDLKADGNSIPVTMYNRQEFVNLYKQFLLETSFKQQFVAFEEGFYSVCSREILKIMHPSELEILTRGSPDYNFYELEKSTKYENGYTKDDPAIINFWKLVHSFPTHLKQKLLSFMCGSDRVPIKGMSSMDFTIQQAKDITRLPAAHTCFNILDLPPYPTIIEMQEKLLYAINNTEGFGLV